MKIRMDYVSNSSSSSFVVFGEKVKTGPDTVIVVKGKTKITRTIEREFDVSAFDNLKEDEAYFIVLKDRGSEGDYIFRLTPEFMMDCDMHQIDFSKLEIYKAKFYMTEGGTLYHASNYSEDSSSYDYDDEDGLREKMKKDGIAIDEMKMFRFDKDYGNPSSHSEILEELEWVAKRSEDEIRNS